MWFLFVNRLNRGRLHAALELVDDDSSSPLYEMQPFMAYLLVESGMTLPPEQKARELSVAGNLEERNAFFAGAYAADSGHWAAHEAAVGMLRQSADRFRASGDSLNHDFNEDAANVLQSYGQWKHGDGTEALTDLEALEPADVTGWATTWWLGELSLELGRRREAAPYFASFWGDGMPLVPLAAFHLGGIYSELGEFEKARQSYEFALLAWEDGDPEMGPRIAAARQGLARLPKPLRRDGQ
jgi:tetratricopeptide (TPR) repeat protein